MNTTRNRDINYSRVFAEKIQSIPELVSDSNQENQENLPESRYARVLSLLRNLLRGGRDQRKKLLELNLVEKQTGKSIETTEAEDKYEPQRLTRKIVWQYDSSAKRIPLLRRDYIA